MYIYEYIYVYIYIQMWNSLNSYQKTYFKVIIFWSKNKHKNIYVLIFSTKSVALLKGDMKRNLDDLEFVGNTFKSQFIKEKTKFISSI